MNKFNTILHPEIILNLRGDKDYREFYKKSLSKINYIEGLGFKSDMDIILAKETDPIFVSHLCVCKKFVLERPSIYHIGSDFLKSLMNIDRKIPLNYLPERFFGYLSFGKDVLKDETGGISGAYVFIGNANETSLGIKYPDQKVAWISYLSDHDISASMLGCALTEDSTVKDIVGSVEANDVSLTKGLIKVDTETLRLRERIYRAIFNTLLYINSYEPVVEKALPFDLLKKQRISKKKLKNNNRIINESTLPVIFVNRQFHGRIYSKDKTHVRGHLRWQRCGVDFEQVKLIWIKDHDRELPTIINERLQNVK